MNLQKIIQETKNNGGYTNSISGRYSVAIKGYEKIVSENEFTVETLEKYISEVGQEFGTWLDNGQVYLDKVECFDNLETALNEAEKREELAIFDLVELKEIRIEGVK